jgi:hypothetical protein
MDQDAPRPAALGRDVLPTSADDPEHDFAISGTTTNAEIRLLQRIR